MTVLNVEDLEGYILGQSPKGTMASAREVYADLRDDSRPVPAPRSGGGLLGGLKRFFQ